MELPLALFSESRSISGKSFTQEKSNKAGTVPLKQRTGERTHWIFFLSLLSCSQPELLTSTKSHPSEFCILFLPPLWLCPWCELGPSRLSMEAARSDNAVLPLCPQLCFDFKFPECSLVNTTCLVNCIICKSHLPASDGRRGKELAVIQLLLCARHWARPSAYIILPNSQK